MTCATSWSLPTAHVRMGLGTEGSVEEEDERPPLVWEIGLEGRAWRGGEAMARLERLPEKLEMMDGRLFWDDEERLQMLAALLENVGLVAAVRLAPLDLWCQAIQQAAG